MGSEMCIRDRNDSTTIAQFLASAGGIVSGLDAGFGARQLSAPNIRKGTATTTIFHFVMQTAAAAGDLLFTHDDGIRVFEDGTQIGAYRNPTSQRDTEIAGFGGGQLSFFYVATNGDPSVLRASVSPVPLPASLSFLLAGFGGLALLRRRNKTA